MRLPGTGGYGAQRARRSGAGNRALRTETTINDTRDFGIGRRLHNLPALRQVGFPANRRLLGVQRISCDPTAEPRPMTGCAARSSSMANVLPALRFDHPATQALLAALVVLRLLRQGFAKRDLRDHLAPLLGREPSAMTQGMTSYHLRRLRLHGLIERIPHMHRYSVTDFGLAAAVFLTRAHARFTGAALGDLVGADPPSPLRKAFERVDTELDRLAHRSRLVA